MEDNMSNQGGMATTDVSAHFEDTIRQLYKDIVIATNKQLESNSEDEGSSDEERQRYCEKKAAKAAEIEAARKARLNPLTVDPNAAWDPSNLTIQKPKRKQRPRKGKTMRHAEDNIDEGEELEFIIPEGDPFDPAKPLHTRMLTAVQVFRQNHRFTPTGAKMFSMYLTYGAMDESAQLSEEFELEVDFEYVVASFLSHFVIHRAGIPQDAAYSITPRVLQAFLVSLRTLKAIPEYDAQIEAAIQVTQQAQDELPLVKAINTDELPFEGRQLHAACFELFISNDGLNLDKLDVSVATDDQSKSNDSSSSNLGSMEESAAIYKDAMRKLGKETRLEGVRVVRRTLPMFLTIEAIDVEKVEDYGVLQLVPYVSTDVDEEEQMEAKTTIRRMELLLPVELAKKLQAGMKMDGSYYELSNGVWFGEPLTLFPSYFRRMVEVSDDILFT
ncbi:hypothetical protein DFQ26_003511 [Actinomortierella ambigua]|nr:hypothetical protein DFQ26_003511 [Actinomortierella ambigua]